MAISTGRFHPRHVAHWLHPTRLFPVREATPAPFVAREGWPMPRLPVGVAIQPVQLAARHDPDLPQPSGSDVSNGLAMLAIRITEQTSGRWMRLHEREEQLLTAALQAAKTDDELRAVNAAAVPNQHDGVGLDAARKALQQSGAPKAWHHHGIARAALGLSDHIRGALFQAWHYLEATACGDPHHLCRAYCLEATFTALHGQRHRQQRDDQVQQGVHRVQTRNHQDGRAHRHRRFPPAR